MTGFRPGERTMETLDRLLELLLVFEWMVRMTDGWPLHESRLTGKLHVTSTMY